jgi:hypothetical protein
MDLLQRKLTKSEWDSIEVPVSVDEQRIIELIRDGYANVHLKRNYTLSLLRHLKIPYTAAIGEYIYAQYLHPPIAKLYAKYKITMPAFMLQAGSASAGVVLKKADIIRFSTTEKQIHDHKEQMFEFVVLDFLENMLKMHTKKNKEWLFYYYTLQIITKYNIDLFNTQLLSVIVSLLAQFESEVDIPTLVGMSYELIERNEHLLKYADETLYDHQKQLFTLCKRPAPKLILYIAPTGTGKTLSPIGLSEGHRIIFVCAARHVGLALAKSAISAHKKVAFAFGCQSAEDIRLHYFAAKEYTKNKKSGGIGKVDNSVGDNVEIMICDIQSYLPAMFYMLAFNKKEQLIMYWDEPTITLDFCEDTDAVQAQADATQADATQTDTNINPLHTIIKENWTKNLIPNIVLSSATLPRKEEISETISSFRARFSLAQVSAEIHEIISYDCKKTIPMLNKEGFAEMPHYLSADYAEIKAIVEHTQNYKTLLRYIDLAEATRFILYINQNGFVKKTRYSLAAQFPSADAVSMANIKNYYLELLGSLNASDWSSQIYPALIKTRKQKQISNINLVTSDAHTLTDGPTIFLADDVDKIAKFYIQSAAIPAHILKEIAAAIAFNTVINTKTAIMEKDFQDGTSKDAEKEKKMGDAERLNPEMKRLMQKIEDMKAQIRTVMLDAVYVPNTKDHLYRHSSNKKDSSTNSASKPFTCDISEHNVEQIMLIDDIEDHWKLLLLMGIGVFSASVASLAKTQNKSDRYTEIMKTLAQEQKLFMLIASSDYIYGTNYQFCHGYISKDLEQMSQEKCIQAMGRIGRNKLQHEYSIRFRENALIRRLFRKDGDKPEVKNMNKLFI